MKKLLALLLILNSVFAAADETPPAKAAIKTFTIKTGNYNGLYYYSGMLIAALNDAPPGGLACGKGGSCGADDLLILNESSSGSVENLQAVCAGKTDSALVQSNLAYMAYNGSGIFSGGKDCKSLRAAASLYPEVLQIAVPKDSNINTLADLKGKIVAVGSAQSGTFDAVRDILTAAGIDIGSVKFSNESLGQGAKDFVEKKIDALAFFAGAPTPIFQQLNAKVPLRFLPIHGAGVDAMLAKSPYYRTFTLPAGTYAGCGEVQTVSVHALWVTTDKQDKHLIYTLTKNLWDEAHRPSWFAALVRQNHFDPAHSLDGIGIPLHDGAKKYYNQIGKRF